MGKRKLTIQEHLEELRRRLIICLSVIILTTILSFVFADKILSILILPVGELIFIAPTEVFFSYLRLAFYGGIFLSMPVILYQGWQFVSSGLKESERKYALLFGPFTFLLFFAGIAFAYFVVLPLGLRFFLNFGPADVLPMLSVANYIAFVSMMLLAFGLVFEVPVIVLFLTKIGLITPAFLAKNRKYVILIIFIAAALFTPPDIVTQILLAVPLLVLFEGSLFLSRFVRSK